MDTCKTATFVASALRLLKERLDRLPEDTGRDKYFEHRIRQAITQLKRKGIALTDEIDDLMLVVDLAAWNHANRDKQGGQPEWLRRRIAGRWFHDS